ncbi:MAG: RidA family protein [Novosphingobium sp.]|nr:RidA family protein [Novosphingobium sp.]
MKRYLNPPTVETPKGPYSQGLEIAPNARWVYVAGQGGSHPDGSMAETLEAQAEQALRNILHVLADAGMDADDIVRMTTYVVTDKRGMDLIIPISKARAAVLGDARPTGTMVVVSGFALPQMLIEIDAVAARAD